MMEVEQIYSNLTNGNDDIITREVNNTLIILSNFGEIPNYSFSNVKRELVINHSTRKRGVDIQDETVLFSDIELYHRVRYLLVSSGKYSFSHDLGDKSGRTVLSEIGSLSGKKENFKFLECFIKTGISKSFLKNFLKLGL